MAYLTDPTTVYPVTIDPTITSKDTMSTSNIEDATVFSGYPNNNFGNYVFNTIGYQDATYGTGRVAVRLKGLLNDETYQSLSAEHIVSVQFYMKDGGSNYAYVNIHALTGNATWTESTVKNSNVGTASETVYDSQRMGGSKWAAFDLTDLAKDWKNGDQNGQCGFLMVIADSAKKIGALSCEYGSGDYWPYVVVTHGVNPFYSDYESADYYRNTYLGDEKIYIKPPLFELVSVYEDDGLQLRANCYGYAFRFFYADNFTPDQITLTENGHSYMCYKQFPGEFADKTNGLTIYAEDNTTEVRTFNKNSDLFDWYKKYYGDNSHDNAYRMHILKQLLIADANTLGYTITEYTGTTIPRATSAPGKRLIAVVATAGDFHFYMQHWDNTWSHKPGEGQPTNLCKGHGHVLTNDNIISHACEGKYAGGELKFFYITKSAVIDYGHLSGTDALAIKTNVRIMELAGNEPFSAKDLGTTPAICQNANIDYTNDVDFYAFSSDSAGSYTFTIQADTAMPLTVSLYDKTGQLLKRETQATGNVCFTHTLAANTEYRLEVKSPGQTAHQKDRKYHVSIQSS